MDKSEVKERLHEGAFGLLVFQDRFGYKKHVHGKVKYLDGDGTVCFKDTDRRKYLVTPENIVSFDDKEMLPAPTENKGRPIIWDGGRFIYKDSGIEVNIQR